MSYIVETVYWVAIGTLAGSVIGELVRPAVLRRRRR
jgi:hypothetical protein